MPPTSKTLERSLGLGSAVMLGLGSILGTGVFVSIGIAAGVTGSSVVLAVGLAALLATCNALSSAQLAASHPVSGGTYEYGYRLLGPVYGFTAGWLFLLAKSASAASAGLGVVWYAANLMGFSDPQFVSTIAILIILTLTLLVASGLKRSHIVNTAIVSITVIALVAFIFAASLKANVSLQETFSPFFAVDGNALTSLLQASALMFVAFTGYGRIATLGEEVKTPRRTIPRAIIITLGVSAALYVGTAIALMMSSGAGAFYNTSTENLPTLEQSARLLGMPGLPTLIALGALTAMLGVLLNLVLGLSRVALAMSRRHDLPSHLSHIAPSGSPVTSVVCVGLFIAGLAMIGDIKTTWTFSAFTVLIYYALTNLCALRQPSSERLYPRWVSVIGLGGCLGLTMFIPFRIACIGLFLIGLGLVWHLAMQRVGRSPPP